MFDQPFRGSAAVASGLVTRGELRGPRFRRLFTDIYVLASAEVDLELRARAAALLVRGRGWLRGGQPPNCSRRPAGLWTRRST